MVNPCRIERGHDQRKMKGLMLMDVEKQIKQFILTRLMHEEDESKLKNDESLFETNIVDSLGVLQLVSFLEEQFNIQVEDEEMVPENFETINILTNYIERKLVSS